MYLGPMFMPKVLAMTVAGSGSTPSTNDSPKSWMNDLFAAATDMA